MNDKRLFSASKFLTQLHVSSFFSRIASKVCQQPAVSEEPPAEGLDDMDRDAAAAIEEIKSDKRNCLGIPAAGASNNL